MSSTIKLKDLLEYTATDAQLTHHHAEQARLQAMNDAQLLSTARHYVSNSTSPRSADGTQQGPGYPSYEAALYHLILPELMRRLEAVPFRIDEKLKPFNGYFHEYRRVRETLEAFLLKYVEHFPPEFGYDELHAMCHRKGWLTVGSDGGCTVYELNVP